MPAGIPQEMRDEFTEGHTCSGAEVIYWLAGVPGAVSSNRVSGVQGIYQAGTVSGVNFEEFGDTGNSSQAGFDNLGFDRRMAETIPIATNECAGCTWGNTADLPSTEIYAEFAVSTQYGSYFQVIE